MDGAFDARSGPAIGQLDGAQVDGSEGGLDCGVDGGLAVLGGGLVGLAGVSAEAGGEVGFPSEFSRVVEEPVAALFDGGLDFGYAGDGPFGVVEAATASLEFSCGAGAFVFEVSEVAILGGDAVMGLVDGGLVGAAEPAPAGEGLRGRRWPPPGCVAFW